MDLSASPSLFQIHKGYTVQKWTKNVYCFLQSFRVLGLCAQSEHGEMWKCWAMRGSVGGSDALVDYSIVQSWGVATCQTMRWLCSAVVGCRSAVGSDKPSSSPPSSPAEEEEEDESNERRARWRRQSFAPETTSPGFSDTLTQPEVDVAFASAHHQVRFWICVRRVGGFGRRVVGARIRGAWRGQGISCPIKRPKVEFSWCDKHLMDISCI